MGKTQLKIIAGLVFFIGAGTLRAEVALSAIFGSHMVLQQGAPIPVWGTANPGEKITVKFKEDVQQATADPAGAWQVSLNPQKAGGPFSLSVTATNSLSVDDVLVGEVWLCSGQSNMAVGAGGAAKQDEVLAQLLTKDALQVRMSFGAKNEWRVATAESAGHLAAIPYVFALRLNQELKVPVGVIVRAMPGTSTDFWISEESLRHDEACLTAIKKYESSVFPNLLKKYDEDKQRWEKNGKPGTKGPERPPAPGKPKMGEDRLGKHYNNLIKPLIPFSIKGVLWDQGENHASIAGPNQFEVMGALVKGWRADWGRGEFPFIYIQKPSGGGCAWDPSNPLNSKASPFTALPETVPQGNGNAVQRDTYVRMAKFPHTELVVSSDLGSGIHPQNKSAYGTRAARVALCTVYGKPGEYCGPLYESHSIEGSSVRIRFSHVGHGLAFKHTDHVQGFIIAGEDKKFIWADAKIDGDTVVVSSPSVARPASVRYAWSADIPWANLFNNDGLPAQAFRTDEW